jgi:hypothetical protein
MPMVHKVVAAMLFVASLAPAWASDKVFLEAAFNSGEIQPNKSTVDGFYIQTLPNPQIKDEGISSGSGGFGPETNWDTKVVAEEQVGAELVVPRVGSHFLRSALYWDKDYNVLNNFREDKPRSTINFAGTSAGQAFEHDEEAWIGFSIFLPSNWEHELGIHDHRGSAMLLSLSDQTRAASAVALSIWTPPGSDKAHWYVRIQTNDAAVEGSAQTLDWVSLGSVEPDLGRWTDFVFRLRSNPFKTATNPAKEGIANSKDKLYEGNRGILQVWKSGGADGDMALKVDRVNSPIGYVPHATRPIEVSFRVYKYGWRKNPTTVKGPIWVGFDAIRYGIADRHGTGYEDVLPPDRARSGSRPQPPLIAVN